MVLRGACNRISDCLAEEVRMKNFELRMGREGKLNAGTIVRSIVLITRPEVPLLNGDLGGSGLVGRSVFCTYLLY